MAGIFFKVADSWGGNDEFTEFLLHMDENPFTDSSSNSHALSISGITRSAVEAKFGGYSASSPGGSVYVRVTDNISFGTQDWTMDLWLKPTSLVGADRAIMAGLYAGGGYWFWRRLSNGDSKISFWTGSTGTGDMTWSSVITTTDWQHLALVRQGTNIDLYKDGVKNTNKSVATAVAVDMDVNRPINIGSDYDSTVGTPAYFEEVRFSNTARWTTDFTAPTRAYQ